MSDSTVPEWRRLYEVSAPVLGWRGRRLRHLICWRNYRHGDGYSRRYAHRSAACGEFNDGTVVNIDAATWPQQKTAPLDLCEVTCRKCLDWAHEIGLFDPGCPMAEPPPPDESALVDFTAEVIARIDEALALEELARLTEWERREVARWAAATKRDGILALLEGR